MSLGALRRVSIDAALLKTIVEQFIERDIHPASDLKAFEELALGLIAKVDPAVAADILQPLHAHPDTPWRVRARLTEARADAETPAMARGSRATTTPPPITDMKALDANRLRELAADLSLDFDPSMRQTLSRAARDDLTLARILLDRDDLDLDPAAFFLAATRLERQAIVLDACRQVLIDGCAAAVPADPALALNFEAAAIARNFDRMAELAASTLHLRHSQTRLIVADAAGEALAMLMVALGLAPVVGARIFSNAPVSGSRNSERSQKLVALMRVTPQRAARQIIYAIAGEISSDQSSPDRVSMREKTATLSDDVASINSRKLPGAA